MGRNLLNDHKIPIPNDIDVLNGFKINQMAIIYANIFHFKARQNIHKYEFWVCKMYTIWQPWSEEVWPMLAG
jgi:hypothetical protein